MPEELRPGLSGEVAAVHRGRKDVPWRPLRREDLRLVTGRGRFIADVSMPDAAEAAILRSPHAHARLGRIDVDRARRGEGVLAVLTGAEVALGCEHGVCGACTVLLDGRSVRSCLLFAIQAEGAELATVEGLASDDGLHPLQRAMSDRHGLQCGFCTPGVLLTACDLLRAEPDPTPERVREALSGNLCRCTGYDGIVRAVLQAARRLRDEASGGDDRM